MHSEATRSLYALVGRLKALGRSQVFGDTEMIALMTPLNFLFNDRWAESDNLVRMTDVSRLMMVSKPAATQVVNKLVERGLVERASDANDRRIVYIRPTEAGRAFYEAGLNRNLDLVDRVIERMGAQDADGLVALLGRFFDALDVETEELHK